ncbi:four-carbon acid sugar kinase family protein [Pontibacter beigongshangensis]|uniref:four-carbon acid sugar kinase family protein n=1 Tax=Pontibacter beigongshangensis TaxID=2574733 RepID=UPI00164F0B24|nr:four-carbon acid sugar kinase family protein [Pontibacter beigongshangensis]
MIAVVADDLTGAAELGGIGLRYNLKVEINAEVNPQSQADLLVISTDTRSKPREEAVRVMTKVTEELLKLQPRLIYKKVDSVLRGHVLAEMEAQLRVLELERALLVPANPSLGRVLVNGEYLINGTPIHETSFSHDPEFAITTSEVRSILGAGELPVHVQQHQEPLPATGIIVGEATSTADLQTWASLTDHSTFAAGASGFFTALLDQLVPQAADSPEAAKDAFGSPALYVCGTTFSESRNAIRKIKENGGPVCYMPAEIALAAAPAEEAFEKWCAAIVSCLHTTGKAIIAIAAETTAGVTTSADDLRKKTARVVQLVFAETVLRELVLEGGSTAFAVLKALHLQEFYPIREAGPGVIRMRVGSKPHLCLTLKPGSYAWGPDIWDFKGTKAGVS